MTRASAVAAMAFLALAPTAATDAPPVQDILFSRYRLIGPNGPLGGTDLTEFRRADGSRSYLSRDRMEFWGPLLERFVVLTFDRERQFDSGHWVGTSEYSQRFAYIFRFDGRAIRGDWQDDVRGEGRTEVPSRPGDPVIGFWGPLESRVLDRFNPAGPSSQVIPVIDVEDSHHRALDITVDRVGLEDVEVPAGRFKTTHYRSERFGRTDHWIDEHGTVIRWASERAAYKWDLEKYPSAAPIEHAATPVAQGVYQMFGPDKQPTGTVTWSIQKETDPDSGLRIVAQERLDERESRFEGVLDQAWHWRRSVETARWIKGEGDGAPEVHHLETFFYRDRAHLLRFRDRAYPLLQSRRVGVPATFYDVDYPITATSWLRNVPRVAGRATRLKDLAHLANRYRGGGLEVQDATVTYLGRQRTESPAGPVTGYQFRVAYPGGWGDSTSVFVTDARFVPLAVKVVTGEGAVEFRLVEYRVVDRGALPEVRP